MDIYTYVFTRTVVVCCDVARARAWAQNVGEGEGTHGRGCGCRRSRGERTGAGWEGGGRAATNDKKKRGATVRAGARTRRGNGCATTNEAGAFGGTRGTVALPECAQDSVAALPVELGG